MAVIHSTGPFTFNTTFHGFFVLIQLLVGRMLSISSFSQEGLLCSEFLECLGVENVYQLLLRLHDILAGCNIPGHGLSFRAL